MTDEVEQEVGEVVEVVGEFSQSRYLQSRILLSSFVFNQTQILGLHTLP